MANGIQKDLGKVTAYSYAKAAGYTGTEEQFQAIFNEFTEDAPGLIDRMDTAVARAEAAVTNIDATIQDAVDDAVEEATASAVATANQAVTDAQAAQTAAEGAVTQANAAVTQANAAVTAAQAAQSAAEDAAESFVLDRTLTDSGAAAPADLVGDLKESFANYDDLKKNIIAPTLFQDAVKKPLGEKYWENFDYTSIDARAVTTIDRANKEHTFYNSVSCKVTKNDTAISDTRMFVPAGSEISLVGISAIRLSIYLEDASLFSSISLEIIGTSWSRAFPISNKKNGWNIFTVYTADGNITTWETARVFRITTSGQANRVFYLDALQFLRRPKGLVILIDDGGYKTFLNDGYPTLKEMNVPVTWAIDTGRIGESHLLSENDIETLSLDGNSEFSFHGHSGNPTRTMSAAELRDDCVSALHYLKKNGLLPNHFWRAAFVQNDAPNYMDVVNIVPVLATGTNNSSPTIFPFPNPYNIPRVALHSQSSPFTTIFDRLQKTHCLYVIYTHGIASTGDYNTTPENWSSFVSVLQTAINDGYVECTTYNRLMTSEDY